MAYTNIDDPSAHFNTITYTHAVTPADRVFTFDGNSNLQPDFSWIKRRDTTTGHILQDSSRGVTKYFGPHTDAAEGTYSGYLKSFNTNGLTIGGGDSASNQGSGGTGVIWAWKAGGGTTSSNTVGTITSTVQANTDAGFSIYTYTGTGAAGTVGHGLGGLPDMIILKGRNTTSSWPVYMDPQRDGSLQFPRLNGTEGNIGNSPFTWDTTKFTFSSGSSYSNTSGTNYIAYAFRSIQGYSKFGSYTGNGNANGAFIYTGFKPAWIMLKPTSAADNWIIVDNKRDDSNPAEKRLFADTQGAEGTGYAVCDMLSNGFKMRATSTSWNGSSRTYIYMAFAENPFVTSTGVPTTAR